jgi:hypothetical protein
MLVWHKKLWLIDHGASLYFHHAWQNAEEQARRPFAHVKDHVLLPVAAELDAVDAAWRDSLNGEKISEIVSLIPDEWLADAPQFETISEHRRAYENFLQTRLSASRIFVEEAQRARKMLV